MTELTSAAIKEFRYWRSSLTAGGVAALAFILTYLRNTPHGAGRFPANSSVGQVLHALKRPEITVALVVFCLIAGELICSLTALLAFVLRKLGNRVLPFDEDAHGWKWWQRLISPISVGEMGTLQRSMEEVPEFQDLRQGDRKFAFRYFLDDAALTPSDGRGADAPLVAAVTQSVTDIRMYLGLLPVLPWLVWEVLAAGGASKLQTLISLFGCVVVLIFAVGMTARRALTLVVRAGSSPALLGVHARAATEASRSPAEVRRRHEELEQ